jgi:hypothetical protein
MCVALVHARSEQERRAVFLHCVFRCVNVNTTDATTGATALLLPAQNVCERVARDR